MASDVLSDNDYLPRVMLTTSKKKALRIDEDGIIPEGVESITDSAFGWLEKRMGVYDCIWSPVKKIIIREPPGIKIPGLLGHNPKRAIVALFYIFKI